MSRRSSAAMGATAAVVAALWLSPTVAADQTATPVGKTPPARVKTAKPWTPPRTADGQPDIQGVWLAQGMGTEPKVGGPFDARSSAAVIEGEFRKAVESGGTLEGVGRCSNLYWEPKPDVDLPKGVVDPPDGAIPLTPWGAARKVEIQAFQKLTDNPPRERIFELVGPDELCLPGTPYPMFNVLPYSGNQFLQFPGYVLLIQEYSHLYRFIPLDGRAHLSPKVRQYMGDSRGHWEGTTLVVDTTNYNGTTGRFDGNPGAGIVQSDATHVVERFKIIDAHTIAYEATIEDPKTFTRPWKIAMPLYRRLEPNMQLIEYRCVEFVEEFLYGNLRKQQLVKHWEGETIAIDVTRKVPAGNKLYDWYRK